MSRLRLRRVQPSPRYSVDVPSDAHETHDERVSSFWMSNSAETLQLSSYVRVSGVQIGAQERLRDRMRQHRHPWNLLKDNLHPDKYVDQASAEFVDDDNVLWI